MASFKVSVFQILIILCAMLYLLQAQAAHSFGKTLPDIGMIKICNISKIYQFGGSKADTGNRRIEDALDQCNLPPYGQSFFGKPTGRCSDGLLMIDYIGTTSLTSVFSSDTVSLLVILVKCFKYSYISHICSSSNSFSSRYPPSKSVSGF